MAFGETPGPSGPAGRAAGEPVPYSFTQAAWPQGLQPHPTQAAGTYCKLLSVHRACLPAPEEGEGLTVTQPDSWHTCRAPGCTPGGGRGQGVTWLGFGWKHLP